MKIIFGGHWKSVENGWVILNEYNCDIRKPLPFPDNSVDAIFTEHVLEHVKFLDGINFLKECYRILKPSGSIRTVMPTITSILNSKYYNDLEGCRQYFKKILLSTYPDIKSAVDESNYMEVLKAVMIDDLTKHHLHKFLWTDTLYVLETTKIGYKTIICDIKDSPASIALERSCRGIHDITDISYKFDLESSCFESIKE
jgi:predicted SAM-dependent methyltransferase